MEALSRAAKAGIPLIAAASCVGIILGVVTLTGVGSKLPSALLPLAQDNLFAALFVLMVSTIILGMGLPSAVCYLLMATLVGPVLTKLGIVPLAAHLFIFYFGMMSMVTPPVALAGYTAAAIAKSNIMRTSFAAFGFALIGFILPYAFILHPSLLLISPDGGSVWGAAAVRVVLILISILFLAVSTAGHCFVRVSRLQRVILFAGAFVVVFLPEANAVYLVIKVAAVLTGGVILYLNSRKSSGSGVEASSDRVLS
jgi:TRAP-type uncharacterized transport system fused permease subunit